MSDHLAGQISFLKMQATIFAGEISSEAVQIFGGRALTRTGMGKNIEMFRRTQKFDAILWVLANDLACTPLTLCCTGAALRRFSATWVCGGL